jgi:hypothetical protein
LTNAAAGAALGAGTKLLFDKLTGKPINLPNILGGGTKPNVGAGTKPSTGAGTKPSTGGSAGAKPNTGGTKIAAKDEAPLTSVVEDKEDPYDANGNLKEGWAINPESGDPYRPVVTNTKIADENNDKDETVANDEVQEENAVADDETELADDETQLEDDITGGQYTSRVTQGDEVLYEKPPTRSLSGNNDATDVSSDETQYFQDEDGNVWTMNADGGYDFFAGNDTYETYDSDTWTDPDTGNVWNLADDGLWELQGNDTYADNTDYTDYTDDTSYDVADNTDYTDYSDDYEYAKRGGFITMMKKGGLPRYAEGDIVEEEVDSEPEAMSTPRSLSAMLEDDTGGADQSYAVDDTSPWTNNGDGTASYWDGDEYVTIDSDSGNELWRTNADGNFVSGEEDYIKQMQFNDYNQRYQSGNPLTNNAITRSLGNAIGGGGGGDAGGASGAGGSSSGFLDTIKGALGTTAGAAGAGALLATLLGSDFGGSSGGQNQGVDMSKVGVINPRTTDFGIGPTRYVGYEDYGVAPDQDYEPNEELLRNLNAPGYNPVNEGDYGYAEDMASSDEMESTDNSEEEGNEVSKMAAGGLSAMAPQGSQTHFTFGKPADVYANLGLRPAPVAEPVDQPQPVAPIQGQQPPSGMPMGLQKPPQQQTGAPMSMPPPPPAGIPQGVPPAGAMRRGGLPHVSNVPQVDGRFDFRNGSAVHGEGDGQSDDIPAMLADGEYVIDAETVAQIGNGSTKAGAQALDKFRESIRAHKRSAPLDKIPPKTKKLTSYLKGAK